MMGFFSLVPVVGSALIWVPAVISLMLQGHPGAGIMLAVICGVVVGLVDNVIRPWVISGRAEMGGLVVFISRARRPGRFRDVGIGARADHRRDGREYAGFVRPGRPRKHRRANHGKKKRRARVAPFGHTRNKGPYLTGVIQ